MPLKSHSADEVLMNSSPIINFYNEKSVFVTGATGFLGTVLVEKLLFSCNGINKIYVIIKRKKEKSIEERFSEYLNSMAFQRIKDNNPDLLKKIVPIKGNLEEEKLGLAENDIKVLQEEVSVVFHAAAKISFNMSVATAVNVNTRSTEKLIDICKGMRNIAVFVYVSSAYSNVNKQVIDEKVYKTGVSLETVYCTLEANNAKGLTEKLLDGRPNTYTYSKALTEELIEKEFDEIPAAIVRPSIIISSAKEPMPGWINGCHGFTSVVAAACRGLLMIWHGYPTIVLDIIPVDHVANLLIAAAWETSESRLMRDLGVKVFNYCSSLRNPIESDHVMNLCVKHGKYFGSDVTANRQFRSISNYVFYKIWFFIYHIIPAFTLDIMCRLIGKEPTTMKTLKKLKRMSSFLEYFTQNQFLFLDSNVRALITKMEDTDRKIFNFDITKIQWESHLQNYAFGISKYTDFYKI